MKGTRVVGLAITTGEAVIVDVVVREGTALSDGTGDSVGEAVWDAVGDGPGEGDTVGACGPSASRVPLTAASIVRACRVTCRIGSVKVILGITQEVALANTTKANREVRCSPRILPPCST
jgi:hypothetical protein